MKEGLTDGCFGPGQTRPGATRRKISTAFLYLLAIGLAAIFLFPVLWSALTSISPGGQASSMPPPFWPTGFTFENYVKLNKYGAGIFQYIFNSGSVAILTVLGTILLSTLGGYGFSRFSFRGKNVLFLVILATLMIPFQSILTPLFLMLGLLGMQNTLVGLALVYITFQLPFGVFIMRNTFDAVPWKSKGGAAGWLQLVHAALPRDACASPPWGCDRSYLRLHQRLERVSGGADHHVAGEEVHPADPADQRAAGCTARWIGARCRRASQSPSCRASCCFCSYSATTSAG